MSLASSDAAECARRPRAQSTDTCDSLSVSGRARASLSEKGEHDASRRGSWARRRRRRRRGCSPLRRPRPGASVSPAGNVLSSSKSAAKRGPFHFKEVAPPALRPVFRQTPGPRECGRERDERAEAAHESHRPEPPASCDSSSRHAHQRDVDVCGGEKRARARSSERFGERPLWKRRLCSDANLPKLPATACLFEDRASLPLERSFFLGKTRTSGGGVASRARDARAVSPTVSARASFLNLTYRRRL